MTQREKTDAEWAAMTLPTSGSCEVTEHEARMDETYFEQLLEYSSSLPTGTFVGKRWKARRYAEGGGWWMVEYVDPHDGDPDRIGIQRRRIMQVRP